MEYGGNDQPYYLNVMHPQRSFSRNMAEYKGTWLPCCFVLRHRCAAVQPSSVLSSSPFIVLFKQLVYKVVSLDTRLIFRDRTFKIQF
jgi:hypothetical protein